MLKLLLLTIASFAVGIGGGASGCHAKRSTEKTRTEAPRQDSGEFMIVAEGFHSSITHSFIAVVRDSETYAELVKLDKNLPKLDQEFFKSKVLIAAFLGERNNGGFSVEIRTEANGDVRVEERAPGKGVMVPQMITSPFKIVSLPASQARLLPALDKTWRQQMSKYEVKTGTFTVTGGFAGTREQFEIKGELQTWSEGNLATVAFGLVSSGPSRQRSLIGIATGIVDSKGHLKINGLPADAFVSPPNGGLTVTGQFTEPKLSLSFKAGPSMIADGYEGGGNLEAEMVSAP